jgi:NAD(P)H-dependent FMN reductase
MDKFMYNIKIISASTRPGRKGPAVASWILEEARNHSDWEVELLDLANINLPFLDEVHHPRLRKYEKRHTKDWSAKIEEADGFIVVTPEYNHGYPAPLKNAFDYLYQEWNYKPLTFISYGGISGGLRAVQQFKSIVTALKMTPIVEAVSIPFFTEFINEKGKFEADESLEKSCHAMLTELLLLTEGLKAMRSRFK